MVGKATGQPVLKGWACMEEKGSETQWEVSPTALPRVFIRRSSFFHMREVARQKGKFNQECLR